MMRFAWLLSVARATVFFSEDFDDTWRERWSPGNTDGAWNHTGGGVQTAEDAKFYTLSASFPQMFGNAGRALHVMYSVRHTKAMTCGGAYLKVLPPTRAETFHGSSPYHIMFGPDICGAQKTHLIFAHGARYVERTNAMACKADTRAHMYALRLASTASGMLYNVTIDGSEVGAGRLLDDWPVLPPETLADPDAVKPDDWVDEPTMADPDDAPPEDWPPKEIPSDETDTLVPNPEYKEWTPKRIANPAFRGPWAPPRIPNPDYVDDDPTFGVYGTLAAIGFDLWQVSSGTIFDDVLVTDEDAVAEAHLQTFLERVEEEVANEVTKEAAKADEVAKADEDVEKEEL